VVGFCLPKSCTFSAGQDFANGLVSDVMNLTVGNPEIDPSQFFDIVPAEEVERNLHSSYSAGTWGILIITGVLFGIAVIASITDMCLSYKR
jgi:hypothetical protein